MVPGRSRRRVGHSVVGSGVMYISWMVDACLPASALQSANASSAAVGRVGMILREEVHSHF